MWGIFFEDINMAADGGLYAELVKNRSFEFNMPLMGWKELSDAAGNGSLLVMNRGQEDPDNPRFIRVTHYADGAYGLSNEGFRGMGIKSGDQYHFSVWNLPHAGSTLSLRIEVVSPKGDKFGSSHLALGGSHPDHDQWQKDTVSFTATATEPKAQLHIWFEGRGTADLDMISLFPQDTWQKRPGGLRADLVNWLADMRPGFIRFPGGCIVEGQGSGDAIPMESDGRMVLRIERRSLIDGTPNSLIVRPPIITSPMDWAFLNISSWPRISAPNRCLFLIAAWLVSSTPPKSFPSAISIPIYRTRSI